MWCAVLTVLVCAGGASGESGAVNTSGAAAGSKYGFYRSMKAPGAGSGASRRVFGGQEAALSEWPGACALVDAAWATHCSASVIRAQWALTAAHCIVPSVTYVRYNSREPSAGGQLAKVSFLYRHPEYQVEQRADSRGMDVVKLHHDVGLVATEEEMGVALVAAVPRAHDTPSYDLDYVLEHDVQVFGFGRTRDQLTNEVLLEARLRTIDCGRDQWLNCLCGTGSWGKSAGVCAGDSGGPVVLDGVQVAITSMGPLECSEEVPGALPRAISVFTLVAPYADLINTTISGSPRGRNMLEVPRAIAAPVAAAPRRPRALFLLVLVLPCR